jgi:hypothetical protein
MRLLHLLTNTIAILVVVTGLVLGPLALLEYTLSGTSVPVDLTEEHRSDELPVETPHPTPAWLELAAVGRTRSPTVGGSQTGLGPRVGFSLDLLRPPNA